MSARLLASSPSLLDQGLSSISNVLAIILVARALDAEAFGTFSLAFAVLAFGLALVRGFLGTRISLTRSSSLATVMTGDAIGAMLVLSPLVSLVVLGVSAMLGGFEVAPEMLVVAVAAPIVYLQDLVRFGAIAAGRPWAAVGSDATWVALVGIGLIIPSQTGTASLMLWLGAAAAALVVGVAGLRPRLSVRGGMALLSERHRTSQSITYGTVVTQSATLVVLGIVASVVGADAVGSLRGASTLIGPVNVALSFVGLALTPALARRTRDADLQFCARTALGLSGLIALWGVFLLVLPESLGSAVLGESWEGARSVLPFTVVEYLAVGIAAGASLGLRVRHLARPLAVTKTMVGASTIVLGTGAALASRTAPAVAAAFAVAALVSAASTWTYLARSQGRSEEQPSAA